MSMLVVIVSAIAGICASCAEMQYVLQIHNTMSKMTQSTKGTLKKRPKASYSGGSERNVKQRRPSSQCSTHANPRYRVDEKSRTGK